MVPPNAKAVEVDPNAGLAGVSKVAAVVAVAGPKLKGAGLELDVAVDGAPLPKLKAFVGAAEEPNVDCAAGASNDGFPNTKVD